MPNRVNFEQYCEITNERLKKHTFFNNQIKSDELISKYDVYIPPEYKLLNKTVAVWI